MGGGFWGERSRAAMRAGPKNVSRRESGFRSPAIAGETALLAPWRSTQPDICPVFCKCEVAVLVASSARTHHVCGERLLARLCLNGVRLCLNGGAFAPPLVLPMGPGVFFLFAGGGRLQQTLISIDAYGRMLFFDADFLKS